VRPPLRSTAEITVIEKLRELTGLGLSRGGNCVDQTANNDASVIVVKEREYAYMLSQLKTPPDIVICDSQVVMKITACVSPLPREYWNGY
jgi:hypothetical protein